MRRSCTFAVFAFAVLQCAAGSSGFAQGGEDGASGRLYLTKDWQIQSSCEAKAAGEEVSAAGFAAKGWHATTIPNTIVGTLVDDKTYPDPHWGTNLQKFPGMENNRQVFFANEDVPADSPFHCSWWFRTEFTLPADYGKKNAWLHFPGINYRANVWVNGRKIADAKDVAGTYRILEWNAGKYVKAGKTNAIALELFAPQKNDLGITWVDWNPTPADKDTGIWKEPYLTHSGDVALRNAFVNSKLTNDYQDAELTLSAEARNDSGHEVKGVLRAEVAGAVLRKDVALHAGETKLVRFTPEEFPKLRLTKPRLWWPYKMGEPNVHTAKFAFEIGKHASDSATVTFGIREVTSELTDKGHRLFKVNGRKVLIRGAAWAPDLFLRPMSKKLDAGLKYVKDMGLNTIRLEGRIDRDEFFEKTDEMGILVMPGWTCCDAWEKWENWTPETRAIAEASMADQARRLRNHPSVFVWLYGSDNPPPPDVEQMYLKTLQDAEWPNPSVSSASEQATRVTGNSGVKMTGPYEYVPPVYWLTDKEAGGAHGYNTETSPGPAIPTTESLKKFIPKEHLWPIDDVWNYHAGGERFTTINVFKDALEKRYGKIDSLEDFQRKAQAMTYDGQRAMFEAYGRNKYTSTGVIQWMLNNAWPSLIWHLYDYYLVPGGGYFGTKKSMEKVHVQYDYDTHSVSVVNDIYEKVAGAKVTAKILGVDAKQAYAHEETKDLPADASVKIFDLPKDFGLTGTYFLKLQLRDAQGQLLSDNFYWLSTNVDTLDWEKRQDTVYTPQKEFGDLTGLNSLPPVKLETSATIDQPMNSPEGRVHVTVKNPSAGAAFMVHLRVATGNGDDVTPVFWEDNYFSLLPGEEKVVSAAYDTAALHGQQPVLEMDGYNVARTAVHARSAR